MPFPLLGSSSNHSHDHADADAESAITTLPARNLHANLSPQERLERLFMFLEAQFGADNVAPVAEPKLPDLPKDAKTDSKKLLENGDGGGDDVAMSEDEDDEEKERARAAQRAAEMERLHKAGIPVPGVRIKVDKMAATVWLEDLEVECASRVFADRVRAVVERAAEVTAPLWG